MNVSNLNRSLDKTIQLFTDETQLLFNGTDSDTPATKEDLFELSKRVAYALDEFRKSIIDNMK